MDPPSKARADRLGLTLTEQSSKYCRRSEKLVQHHARGLACLQMPLLAIAQQHRDRDRGLVGRREPHEPGVRQVARLGTAETAGLASYLQVRGQHLAPTLVAESL